MIYVFHKYFKITRVLCDTFDFKYLIGFDILKGINELIRVCPDNTVVWCNEDYAVYLDSQAIHKLPLSPYVVYSFNPNKEDFFNRVIGYVDLSIFVSIQQNSRYPTWLMSSESGVATLSLFKLALNAIADNSDFDYFLKSFAKLSQSQGVFCYSEPSILTGFTFEKKTSSLRNSFKVMRFTKQHFKLGWIFILLYAFFFHEKFHTVFGFLSSFFFKRRTFKYKIIHDNLTSSTSLDVSQIGIDILIPTIGRAKYLYDVLFDLKQQILLPKKVIIIEQNPDENSNSSLNYLCDEIWPFEIAHTFTHQAGACNARNIGLDSVVNDWVFLADDDIRIAPDFLKQALQKMIALNCEAASFKCESSSFNFDEDTVPFQWGGFGSGSSIVKKSAITDCYFGKGYEFGFGEDGDFGMQIRNKGIDVLFFEQPYLIHLKAPMGGFRTKPILDWANEPFMPKPSPTVMLYRIKNCTKSQNITYKLKLLLGYYRSQNIKNPFTYYRVFQKQWQTSLKWANILNNRNEL